MQTDLESIIGFFCKNKWEDTSKMTNSHNEIGWKDADNPFLFYFSEEKIEIIKHREDMIPTIVSDN